MTTAPRPLPGDPATCGRCGSPIVWATTLAGPNGPGGKAQPFDPVEHPDGRVAIQPRARGTLYARALAADEDVDTPWELRGMPHAATCSGVGGPENPGTPTLDGEVIDLDRAREAFARRRRIERDRRRNR